MGPPDEGNHPWGQVQNLTLQQPREIMTVAGEVLMEGGRLEGAECL
jgi:hypothetical protein